MQGLNVDVHLIANHSVKRNENQEHNYNVIGGISTSISFKLRVTDTFEIDQLATATACSFPLCLSEGSGQIHFQHLASHSANLPKRRQGLASYSNQNIISITRRPKENTVKFTVLQSSNGGRRQTRG